MSASSASLAAPVAPVAPNLPLEAAVPWPQQLRESLSSAADLLRAGLVDAAQAEALAPALRRFRFRVPRAYAALFDATDLRGCPLFRQAVPDLAEADVSLPAWAQALSQRAYGRPEPWQADAIGDVAHLAAPRLTHRYSHRALLHVTAACALYCRFCFRKAHLAHDEADLYSGSLAPALAYLQAHPEIDEVILTGGDPLSMADGYVQRLMAALADVPHLRTIRLHSRMASSLPARLTPALWAALDARRPDQQAVLVSHFNHPRELTPQAIDNLRAGARAGVLMLNQSVLLAGVNDQLETLAALCRGLWRAGVVPYYLHHPDWTPGTMGFRVTIAQGRALVGALAGRLSGPALPTYVLDVPFGRGKARLMETSVVALDDPLAHGRDAHYVGGLWQVRTPATRAGGGEPVLYLDLALTPAGHARRRSAH